MPRVLTFRISGGDYALPLAGVREIVRWTGAEGELLPVVVAARLLGLPEKPPTRRTCILVLEGRRGLLVDEVIDTVEVAEILPPPSLGPRQPWLTGVFRARDKLHFLLDGARLSS